MAAGGGGRICSRAIQDNVFGSPYLAQAIVDYSGERDSFAVISKTATNALNISISLTKAAYAADPIISEYIPEEAEEQSDFKVVAKTISAIKKTLPLPNVILSARQLRALVEKDREEKPLIVLFEAILAMIPEEIHPLINGTQQEKMLQIREWLHTNTDAIEGIVKLNVINSNIFIFPKEIALLRNLIFLDLSGNRLTSLSEIFQDLPNLRSLYLMNNRLRTLPRSIGSLSDLKTLNAYNNELTELPESIGNLRDLRTLSIAKNRIRRLPETIGNLFELQRLYLIENQIRYLPSAIENLRKLEKLYISDNPLIELPLSIRRLPMLCELDLRKTALREIPLCIRRLPQLKKLYLSRDQMHLFETPQRTRLDLSRRAILHHRESATPPHDDSNGSVNNDTLTTSFLTAIENASPLVTGATVFGVLAVFFGVFNYFNEE